MRAAPLCTDNNEIGLLCFRSHEDQVDEPLRAWISNATCGRTDEPQERKIDQSTIRMLYEKSKSGE